MTAHTTTTTRILAASALAAVLVLAPAAAQAHVGITDDGAEPGAQTELTFGFGHGCDGSPTTALEISVPDGLTGVHPVADPGWTIDIARDGEAGRVSTVTYTAVEAIPDALRGEARMQVGIADDAEGPLAFPVDQICETGSTSWSEIAAEGEDPHDLAAPAPLLALDGEEAHAHDDATAEADADAETEAASPLGAVGTWLGGAALAVSLAALGVAISSRRTR